MIKKERISILPTEWNSTDHHKFLNHTLSELLGEKFKECRDNKALFFAGEWMTFLELDEKSNQCAHYLRQIGVSSNTIVGVMMERSFEMMIALMAIIKAGGAYLPLDPQSPGERIEYIVENANVYVVLTQERFERKIVFDGTMISLDRHQDFLQTFDQTDLDHVSNPKDLAYIIYTSGSSGKPKGCMISHEAICNRLLWMREEYKIQKSDRILHKTPFTFDVSVWELFLPGISGASMIISKPDGHKDNSYLIDLMTQTNVTICHFVPSMLHFFLSNRRVEQCVSLSKVFCSGEALSYELLQRFKNLLPNASLHNLYGPTEAAVDVTYWKCEENDRHIVPIGKPISNIQLYIVDEELKEVEVGKEGELLIGGIGLAKGYLNNKELTDEKFIKNPFINTLGERLYRTGDKARFLPDGSIEYLGRLDNQVKLRGNRIELGEIESAILELQGIESVAVAVKDEQTVDPKLVAYVVTEKDLTLKSLRAFLGKKLPDYMLPNAIKKLEELPVTVHGKLDRKLLPWTMNETCAGENRETTQMVNNTAENRKKIREFILEVLSIDKLDDEDDFFDIGATSLTLTVIVDFIQKEFGIEVPLEVILDQPNVLALLGIVGDAACANTETNVNIHNGQATKGEVSAMNLYKFLSLLKVRIIDGKEKYLYPTAGGLNAVQIYLYIKAGYVEGIEEGIYYYHQYKHCLYSISKHEISSSAFSKWDLEVYKESAFMVFFIAQMKAIKPEYHGMSPILVQIDSGYMEQLLISQQDYYNMNVIPAYGVDYSQLRADFDLDLEHEFVTSLYVSDKKVNKIEGSYVPDVSYEDRNEIQKIREKNQIEVNFNAKDSLKGFRFLNKEQHDNFHKQKLHLRDIKDEKAFPIPYMEDFDVFRYRKRTSIREYLKEEISQNELERFLTLLRRNHSCLLQSKEIEIYFYIKKERVEGLSEGIYQYDAIHHSLLEINTSIGVRIKASYMPFNRKHFEGSAFCMFIAGNLENAKKEGFGAEQELLLRESGHIGQILMDNQEAFDMGICPIGGLDFERIRQEFKVGSDVVLLHSFTCGKYIFTRENSEVSEDEKHLDQSLSQVAIIGMSGRFSDSKNVDDLWESLKAGKEMARFPDEKRIALFESSNEDCTKIKKIKMNYMDDIDQFDSLHFNITPSEAAIMDPQERLLLERVWGALEDSGYNSKALASKRVGVFVGAMWGDYEHYSVGDETVLPNSLHSSLANRISYYFDFSGPSIAVNTSCSSGATVIHLANESILKGDCDIAIAAGVNMISHKYHLETLQSLGFISKSNKASPFSAKADGWIAGEGVGVLILKAAKQSIMEHDNIHAMILGTDISHNGKCNRFGAPNPQKQQKSIESALKKCGLSIDDIDYVEMAAPGTSINDASEFSAHSILKKDSKKILRYGSVKGQYGHLESASTILQIMKVILQYKHNMLVSTINTEPGNPLMNKMNAPLSLVNENLVVDQEKVPYNTVLINAFGATGSNGHIILKRYHQMKCEERKDSYIVPFSARTKEQLSILLREISDYLDNNQLPIQDIAKTLSAGRYHFSERIAVIADQKETLVSRIREYLSGIRSSYVYDTENIEITGTEDDASALAKNWVSTQATLPDYNGKRISLPTYPFAKECHWINGKRIKKDNRNDDTKSYLVALLMSVSGLSREQISIEENFSTYGINSFMITTMNDRLEKDLGILEKTLFFEYSNIRELSEYIDSEGNENIVETKDIAPKCSVAETTDDIAIIGLSGRYPHADNIYEFWDNLKDGKDCIDIIPSDRWDYRAYYSEGTPKKEKCNSKWGGFINDIDKFDSLFFKISPREADRLDPQERIFLETAWHAIEDAGYSKDELFDKFKGNIGVYVGVMYGDYQILNQDVGEDVMINTFGSIANRVSTILDLHGPSMAVDTLCSSSLTALHLACQSIRQGECRAAIAGGVNLSLHPYKYIAQSNINMLSTEGKCRSFGEGGNGFVSGEGVGAILIKPLNKAVEDGDHIYGIIKATSINHGGKTNGYTVPNPKSQADLLYDSISKSGLSANSITYVEAHGTGTPLGDPIEIKALNDTFKKYTDEKQFCSIGSVKSNIGHLESAAGIAGITKVLLQMKYKTLVPTLHADEVNRNIDFSKTPFYLQRELKEWQLDDENTSRAAVVSSFGASGANANVIIEEYVGEQNIKLNHNKETVTVLLSARTQKQLLTYARDLYNHLEKRGRNLSIIDIAYTLQAGRTHGNSRVGFIVGSVSELMNKLSDFLQNIISSGIYIYDKTKEDYAESDTTADEAILMNWIQGKTVDWKQVDYKDTPHRVSLPGYPFERVRHWISVSNNKMHPLLQRNMSTEHLTKFTSVFHGRESFFRDHMIQGKKILPAAAYIEMIYNAARFARDIDEESSIELSNINWVTPFIIDDANKEIEVRLEDKKEGIRSYIENKENGVFCKGNIRYVTKEKGKKIDIQELLTNCLRDSISSEKCYQCYSSIGIEYGESHRTINKLHVGEQNVVAELRLSKADDQNYIINPSMLDGAFQGVIGFMNLDQFSEGNSPYIPYEVEHISVYNEFTEHMWADISKQESNTENVERYNIEMYANSGERCLSITGISFRKAAFENQRTVQAAVDLLQPAYVKRDLNDGSQKTFGKRYIFTYGIEGIEGHHERIDVLGKHPIEDFMFYADKFFEKIKKIVCDSGKKHILIQFVVYGNEEVHLLESLMGILMTANKECDNLRYQYICLDNLEELPQILDENSKSDRNFFARYIDGVRYEKEYKKSDQKNVQNNTKPIWRDNGRYIISGGSGELAFLTLHEIFQHAPRASVVLVSRSILSNEKRKVMEAVERNGGRIEYVQADITDKDDLLRKLDGYEFDGVIHCAGILNDKLIKNKSNSDFCDVLAPKVLGAIHLDYLTRNSELDFFVMFSSLSAVQGNIGQADYAAGNYFLDIFSEYRNSRKGNQGKTISINWPYWLNGGMKISREKLEHLYKNSGIAAISNKQGMEILREIISDYHGQVIVLSSTPETDRNEESVERKQNSEKDVSKMLEEISQVLKRKVSEILKVAVSDIDLSTELSDYGFDSITFTEYADSINSEFETAVTPTIFYEYRTIGKVSLYLLEEYPHLFQEEDHEEAMEEDKVDKPVEKELKRNSDSHNIALNYSDDSGIKEPIAIIGVSGRFPHANGLEEFWDVLMSGEDTITEIPKDRWNWENVLKSEPSTEMNWGAFIDGVYEFDPLFFQISPKEAAGMDPQQRLLMSYVWKAIEDAGISKEELTGTKTSMYIGTTSSGYDDLLEKANIDLDGYSSTGMAPSVGPNRMSYFLDIHGPSEPIETACSSSLVAIHRAVGSIRNENCKTAIAGGVNVMIHPKQQIMFGKSGMLSKDGRCKTFSKYADGYVRGEGAGIIILKKLSDAEKDGDHIYGLIRGSNVNHGGKAASLTAPNPQAQKDLIVEAYTDANISPSTVNYIEAHGTGTALGDPIEVNALKESFALLDPSLKSGQQPHCALGSVKTNIGHLELAAGIAGVIKVLLQMKHGLIVKSLHSEELNPYIQFNNSPFYVSQENHEWERLYDSDGNELPRRAGISSFGFGGVNAHLILEEYLKPQVEKKNPEKEIIVLSCKTKEQLLQHIKNFHKFLVTNDIKDHSLTDIAYTLQVGRTHFEHRFAFIASSVDEVKKTLAAYLSGESDAGTWYGEVRKEGLRKLMYEDEDANIMLEQWIEKEKYNKIIQLWVDGMNLDWKLFNRKYIKKSKVSLPTYPFERQQYRVVVEKMIQKESNSEPVKDLADGKNIQEICISIVAEILQIPENQIELNTDLIEYGFDSISCMAFVKQISSMYQADIALGVIFANRSIEKIAKYIEDHLGEPVTPKCMKTKQLKQQYPLSKGQLGMWVVDKLEDESSSYNIPNAFQINGQVDIDRLNRAFASVQKAYPILSTTLKEEAGIPYNHLNQITELKVMEENIPNTSDRNAVLDMIKNRAREVFDLNEGPLIKIYLFHLGSEQQILLINAHHIIFDGTSLLIFLKNLIRFYENPNSEIKLDYEPYSEFTTNQESKLLNGSMDEHKKYWNKIVDHGINNCMLPFEKVGLEHGSNESSMIVQDIPVHVGHKMEADCKQLGVSPFTYSIAAFFSLLYRYSNQNQITLSTVVDNRDSGLFEQCIGNFINTVLINCDFEKNIRFADLVEQVKSNLYQLFEFKDYPYMELMNTRKKEKNETLPNPNIIFLFHNWIKDLKFLSGDGTNDVSFEYIPEIQQQSTADISFELMKYSDRYKVTLKYNTNKYDSQRLELFVQQYILFMEKINIDTNQKINEINILTNHELEQINCWNDTNTFFPKDKCLQELFEKQVELNPDREAVIFKGNSYSYGELNAKINQLAWYLRKMGVTRNDVVGVRIERSFDMIVALYGVIKAGGAYTPIGLDYPQERVKYILDNSGAKVLLVNDNSIIDCGQSDVTIININDAAIAGEDIKNPDCINRSKDLAYVIYTSGSTGNPKGVMVEHMALINRLKWSNKVSNIKQDDIILQKTTYTFDCSIWELFYWSIEGSRVCFLPEGEEMDPQRISDCIREQGITLIHFVPSMLKIFLDYTSSFVDMKELSSLKQVFTTGEALTSQHVTLFAKTLYSHNNTELINLYGPTEATIEVSYFKCSFENPLENVPIGRPIDNTKLYIINDSMQLQPVGVSGELCIAGIPLARGYINNRQLTDKVFVDNPFDKKGKMYKTGDLCRWLEDGNIEFLGRIDRQVKIRGIRIELGEIEAKLLELEGVKEAHAFLDDKKDKSGNDRIKAAVVGTDHFSGIDTIKTQLKDMLPEYMLPSSIILVDKMPLTGNGKLDTKVLVNMNNTEQVKRSGSSLKETILQIFEEIFEKSDINEDQNFLDIGGHSLLLVTAAMRIREVTGKEIVPADLFKYPTINQIYSYLTGGLRNTRVKNAREKAKRRRTFLSKMNE